VTRQSGCVPRRPRLIVAMLLGLVSGHLMLLLVPRFALPRDLTPFWYAARVLLHRGDPYASIGPGAAFDYPWPLVYPLTSVVAVLPLAGVSATWACAIFAGVASACLAWALMEQGYSSLLAYASVCVWQAIFVVQWSPLFTASMVIAPLGVLLAVKPTVGVAYFVARPSWWAVCGGASLVAIAFVLDPGWVGQWTASLGRAVSIAKHGFPYRAPALMPGGILVLTALSRWRRAEARLLVALALVPHTTLPYELLPLLLIPRGWRQMGALVALTHLMWWIVRLGGPQPDFYSTVIEYTRTAIPCVYLPCTLLVLRRPNVGAIPAWLEPRVATWPQWVRGTPTTA
jgi:hypothetical protein